MYGNESVFFSIKYVWAKDSLTLQKINLKENKKEKEMLSSQKIKLL